MEHVVPQDAGGYLHVKNLPRILGSLPSKWFGRGESGADSNDNARLAVVPGAEAITQVAETHFGISGGLAGSARTGD